MPAAPERPVPAFEREPGVAIAQDSALHGPASHTPASSLVGSDLDLHERTAELEAQLAASQASLAEAIERRQRAEEALANTQVEHLRALRRIAALEQRVTDDPDRTPPGLAEGSTEVPRIEPVATPLPVDSDTPSVSTALMSKIASLREAVAAYASDADDEAEFARGEEFQSEIGAAAFRERLTRAAEARHRPAS